MPTIADKPDIGCLKVSSKSSPASVAGAIAGMVKERMSCKQLIDKLVSETDALIKGAGFYE